MPATTKVEVSKLIDEKNAKRNRSRCGNVISAQRLEFEV